MTIHRNPTELRNVFPWLVFTNNMIFNATPFEIFPLSSDESGYGHESVKPSLSVAWSNEKYWVTAVCHIFECIRLLGESRRKNMVMWEIFPFHGVIRMYSYTHILRLDSNICSIYLSIYVYIPICFQCPCKQHTEVTGSIGTLVTFAKSYMWWLDAVIANYCSTTK